MESEAEHNLEPNGRLTEQVNNQPYGEPDGQQNRLPNVVARTNRPFESSLSHLPIIPLYLPVTVTVYSRIVRMFIPRDAQYFRVVRPYFESITATTEKLKMTSMDECVIRMGVRQLWRLYTDILNTNISPDEKLSRMKTVMGLEGCINIAFFKKYKHYEMFTINVFGKFNKIDELLTDVMNLENFGEKSLTPTPTMAIETAELIVKTLAKLMDEQFQPGSRALGNW